MHRPRGADVGAGFAPEQAPDGPPLGRPLQANSWIACMDQEALMRGTGFAPKQAPNSLRTLLGQPLQARFLDGMHGPRGDAGHRVHTQTGTRQDTVGLTTTSQVVPGEIYILCGWHTTYSLMAKLKALPTNKKWKAASKGTKAPTKMAWKKLNTGNSKCHGSDASDDNTSSSDTEPPPPPKTFETR